MYYIKASFQIEPLTSTVCFTHIAHMLRTYYTHMVHNNGFGGIEPGCQPCHVWGSSHPYHCPFHM